MLPRTSIWISSYPGLVAAELHPFRDIWIKPITKRITSKSLKHTHFISNQIECYRQWRSIINPTVKWNKMFGLRKYLSDHTFLFCRVYEDKEFTYKEKGFDQFLLIKHLCTRPCTKLWGFWDQSNKALDKELTFLYQGHF